MSALQLYKIASWCALLSLLLIAGGILGYLSLGVYQAGAEVFLASVSPLQARLMQLYVISLILGLLLQAVPPWLLCTLARSDAKLYAALGAGAWCLGALLLALAFITLAAQGSLATHYQHAADGDIRSAALAAYRALGAFGDGAASLTPIIIGIALTLLSGAMLSSPEFPSWLGGWALVLGPVWIAFTLLSQWLELRPSWPILLLGLLMAQLWLLVVGARLWLTARAATRPSPRTEPRPIRRRR